VTVASAAAGAGPSNAAPPTLRTTARPHEANRRAPVRPVVGFDNAAVHTKARNRRGGVLDQQGAMSGKLASETSRKIMKAARI
jgi:hypothetical protein